MGKYLSYLIGAKNIPDDELTKIGITIIGKSESGSRKLEVPSTNLQQFMGLLSNKLDPGFWNEIVGATKILFLFKFKDGTTKQYILSTENEHEIDKLCAKFNNEPADKTANVYKYLSENDYYHDFMEKYYFDLINR